MEVGAYHKNAALPSHPLRGGQGKRAVLGSQPDPTHRCQLAPSAELNSGCYSGGKITCLKIYILQFMTIWHLGLNKSPIVAPRMPCDGCLAGGCGKNGNQKGERDFFFI